MKKKLFLMIAVLCCMLLLVATVAACEDKGDTGENPGGDVTENPGGDNPGGENPDPGEIEVFKMVSFDMNGGEGQIADMNFKVGAVMANLPVPTRDGYKFICWVDDISEEEYTAESVMPNNDLSLKAKWEKIISGYSDDFVSFKPSSEGVKDTLIFDLYRNEVDKFVYVEISSDDLGGVENVGKQNNFTLRALEGMQYAVQPGYSWTWYQGDFDTPNGAQRFTLDYGSNIQFVTISDSSGVVRQTYLLDIYVKHDYYVYLYKNVFEQSPYNKVRVIENDCFDQDTAIYESPKFEFDSRVYYNETTGTYEKFVYSTVIKKDWNLYQTYKPVTLEAELNEGTLDNDLVITPYTQYFTLPSAQKSGFDFIGWKLADDRFITNIQGYSGTNYLSEENCPDKLIADFEAKKNYYTFDGTELKTVRTVPTVIYTDNTMSEIFDIVYTPYNTDCVLPTKVPYDNNNIFKEWSWYYKNSNGEFSKYFSVYNFNKKITEPLALVPTMESCNDNVIPLNQTVTSSGYKTYKMYLPVSQTYTLKVTTTGNVRFTISLQEGSTQGEHTYTVTSSGSPKNISLRCYVYNYGSQVTTFGYVGLTIDSYSGTYSFTLIGDTAQSEGNPVVTSDENTASVGEEFTVQLSKPGYAFAGWYKDGIKISDTEFLTMEEEESTYTAEWIECPVTIEKSINEAGTVSGIPETTFVGQEITVTATSKPGYTWVGWYNGETLLTDDLSYTFNMPEQDITYTAKWIKVTVNKSTSNAGSVTALNSTYKVGDSVTITATTNSGYTWVGWFNDDTELTKEQSYTFNMPAENLTYTAKWIKVTVNKSTSNAGSVTALNSTYKVGDSVTITATTYSGYTWLGWYNGEEELTKDASYTFTMPSENVQFTAKWAAYTVTTRTEDSSAGSVTYMNAVKTRAGDEVTITATPRTGYTFVGWYEDDTLISTDLVYTFSMPAKSIIYSAKWTYYTLTTELNDADAGSISGYAAQKISVGQSVTIEAETNNGYTFLGWYNGEILLSADAIYTFDMPAEDIVYTAKWTAYSLTVEITEGGCLDTNYAVVSFNLNDGTGSVLSEQRITDSIGLVYPDFPARSGYAFAGWYDNADCTGLPFDFSTTVYADTMLYARWVPYVGTGVISINSQIEVSVVSKSSSNKVYYAFVPLSDGTITLYTTGSLDTYGYLYDSDKKQLKTNDDDGDGNNFKITYNVTAGTLYYVSPCGYSSSGSTTLHVTGAIPEAGGKFYGEDIDWQAGHIATAGTVIRFCVVTNSGYTFAGWYKDGELVSRDLDYNFTMLPENVVLVAQWIECPVTLEKNMDEAGSVSGLESPVVVGENVTITASTNNGYTWLGWYAGDSLLTSEPSYTFAMPSENTVYTAKWSKVTLESSHAERGTVPSLTETYTAGQSVTVEATTIPGYTFVGWFKDGELAESDPEFTFEMPSEDTVYTAKWSKVTLESSDAESGTVPSLTETYTAGQSVTVEAETNTGYTFVGWFKGGELVESGLTLTFEMPSEDTVYTAKWIKVTIEKSIADAGSVTELTDTYIQGEEIVLNASTNPGYTWVGWYQGNQLLSQDPEYTFVMPSENITYTALWIKLSVNKNIFEAGNITTLDGIYKPGDPITVEATTNLGYTWLGWYNDNTLLTEELEYQLSMPDENFTLTAKWSLNNDMAGFIFTSTDKTCIIDGLDDDTIMEVTIPEYITGIADDVFKNCYQLVLVCNLSSLDIVAGEVSNGYVGYYAKKILTEPSENKWFDEVNNFVFFVDENIYLLDYKGTSTSLVLPESYNGQNYQVNANAFRESSIKSVIVSKGVNELGNYSFYKCSALKEITILSDNVIIGSAVFGDCIIEKATIPTSIITYIPQKNLVTVVINGGNSIPDNAFYDCDTLAKITIPNSVESIGKAAFYGCNQLNNIQIPRSIKMIGDIAFARSGIASINIPQTVTSLGGGMFWGSSLTSATINANVKELPSYKDGSSTRYTLRGFFYGSLIASVKLPETLEIISDNMFYQCTWLESIVIPDSVTTISRNAFYDCSQLSSITIGRGVTEIIGGAFTQCYNLYSAKFLNPTGWRIKDKYGQYTDLTEEEVKGYETNSYILFQSWWNALERA